MIDPRPLLTCSFCEHQTYSGYALAVHEHQQHSDRIVWETIEYDDTAEPCDGCGHRKALNGPFAGGTLHSGGCPAVERPVK